MLYSLWTTLLYKPMVNLLATLVAIVPGGDVGLAVIIMTILVKIVLFPLASKSIKSQAKMNLIQPEMDKIKNSGKTKEEQSRMMLDLYKKHKTNPGAGCLLLLIQIPIVIALYYSFYKGINFSADMLYSFTPTPGAVSNMFLGFVDVGGKSIVLAVLAGLAQFLQAYYMPQPSQTAKTGSFSESLQKSMHLQMKYVFPVVMAFFAYSISGVVALYLITSSLFAAAQQVYLAKKKEIILAN